MSDHAASSHAPSRPTRGRRSTPAGDHRPVLLEDVLRILAPTEGAIAVDCTLGAGGHARAILERLGPTGRLIALECDLGELERTRAKLTDLGPRLRTHHANFADLPTVLAAEQLSAVDLIFADLGMSSMQLDDPIRGFSYVRDGPLDMRMNRAGGATAAQVLQRMSAEQIAEALRVFGDEPNADEIAAAIVARRGRERLKTTAQLASVVGAAIAQPVSRSGGWRLRDRRGQWHIHPAARTFQTLRILVNRELDNLDRLLEVVPTCLRTGGRVGIISFHSGEDRLVKTAFRDCFRAGLYSSVASEPCQSGEAERRDNPRSRSAKLRWAVRSN